jgi:hypothetical protein
MYHFGGAILYSIHLEFFRKKFLHKKLQMQFKKIENQILKSVHFCISKLISKRHLVFIRHFDFFFKEVHSTISRWISAMLSNRMIWPEIRGVSSTMMVRRRCPHGGGLSPLLWNVVINFLLSRLNNESLWAQGFADNIAIFINGKFLSTVFELMQKTRFIVQT